MPSFDDEHHDGLSPGYWLNELRQADVGGARWSNAVNALAAGSDSVIEVLIEALADASTSVRCGADKALQRIGPSTIAAFIKALRQPNNDIRAAAARALYGLGNDALEALPDLTDALKDRDQFVRQWAATALERLAWDLGPAVKSAVTSLIQTLQDDDYLVREWSALALGTIGADAAEAVPFLERAMVDDVPSVRAAAIEALNKISPLASDAD